MAARWIGRQDELEFVIFSKSGFTRRMLDIEKENAGIFLIHEERFTKKINKNRLLNITAEISWRKHLFRYLRIMVNDNPHSNRFTLIAWACRLWFVYKQKTIKYTNTNRISCYDSKMSWRKGMQIKETVEESVGRQIQRIRRERGYTQQVFSEMVGISTNYLSDVER